MSEEHGPSASKDPYVFFPNSAFMESLTHISPLAVLLFWAPVIVFFGVLSFVFAPEGMAFWYIPLAWVIGIIMWTFAEYMLHRFLFHMPVESELGKKISFLFHGVHHMQPMVKTRLVMPPLVSIPLATIFYGLFYLGFVVLGGIPQWLYPAFAGFATGYLFYDMGHYAMHHFNLKSGYLKMIRKHHMQHHVQTPNMRFGVSSPFWDYVFRTEPKSGSKA